MVSLPRLLGEVSPFGSNKPRTQTNSAILDWILSLGSQAGASKSPTIWLPLEFLRLEPTIRCPNLTAAASVLTTLLIADPPPQLGTDVGPRGLI